MSRPLLRGSVSIAVEGDLDDAVARKLIEAAGAQPGTTYGRSGKAALRKGIAGYNNAARLGPWLVLVDLDREAGCAPSLRKDWIPNPSRLLCFRVVVRQVEAWLIADGEAISEYLGVTLRAVTREPESLDDAKAAMVNLARRSRRKAVRKDMVPRDGSGRSTGPAYTSRLIQYVETNWRPETAAGNSESLRRSIRCVERIGGVAS